MDGENSHDHEAQKMVLLEKINKALTDLGSTSKWLRTPEFLEGYTPLKDKIIVMVDDIRGILEHFAPHLIVATDGKAFFIEYKDQRLDELVRQIMEYNPNIVIMDYHLSSNLKGTSVIKALRGQNFSGEIIGFSSDNHAAKNFTDIGVRGIVDKSGHSPERSVEQMASMFLEKSAGDIDSVKSEYKP